MNSWVYLPPLILAAFFTALYVANEIHTRACRRRWNK